MAARTLDFALPPSEGAAAGAGFGVCAELRGLIERCREALRSPPDSPALVTSTSSAVAPLADFLASLKDYGEESNEELQECLRAELLGFPASPISETLCATLAAWYQGGGLVRIRIVLGVLPAVLWSYLSAVGKRATTFVKEAESLLLAIYRAKDAASAASQWQMPTLAKPSIYHESPQNVKSLTANSLKQLESTSTVKPNSGPDVKRLCASNRAQVLAAVLETLAKHLGELPAAAVEQACTVWEMMASAGFTFSKSVGGHARVRLSETMVIEMMRVAKFALYHGCHNTAHDALSALEQRCTFEAFHAGSLLAAAIFRQTKGAAPRDDNSLSFFAGVRPYFPATTSTLPSTEHGSQAQLIQEIVKARADSIASIKVPGSFVDEPQAGSVVSQSDVVVAARGPSHVSLPASPPPRIDISAPDTQQPQPSPPKMVVELMDQRHVPLSPQSQFQLKSTATESSV